TAVDRDLVDRVRRAVQEIHKGVVHGEADGHLLRGGEHRGPARTHAGGARPAADVAADTAVIAVGEQVHTLAIAQCEARGTGAQSGRAHLVRPTHRAVRLELVDGTVDADA